MKSKPAIIDPPITVEQIKRDVPSIAEARDHHVAPRKLAW
jgi:hypothetical protein